MIASSPGTPSQGASSQGALPPDASLGMVLPGIADALGVDATSPELVAVGRDGVASRASLDLALGERICVVLIDGLGWNQLRERSGHAPFLRSLLSSSRPLNSAFPATTATSMGLFGTGLGPGYTGLAGYTVMDPATASPVNLLKWDTPTPPEQWQRHRTIFETVASAGVDVTFVGEQKFAGSGLTRAALRGAEFVAGGSTHDRADVVLKLLRRPGLVYLYWGELDRVGHQRGVSSLEWGDALTEVDSALKHIARAMPPGTQLVVTADHGMIDVPQHARFDVAHEPALAEGVDLVAGEHRAAHVYCAPDQAQAVAARWMDRLGDAAWVATREDAIAQGWFGPLSPGVVPVIGNVIVATATPIAILDSRHQSPSALRLVGLHGSMTADETQVPFIVVS